MRGKAQWQAECIKRENVVVGEEVGGGWQIWKIVHTFIKILAMPLTTSAPTVPYCHSRCQNLLCKSDYCREQFFKVRYLVGRVFYNLAKKSQGIRPYQSKNSLEFVFPLPLSQSEYLRGCLHLGTTAWVSTQYGFVFTPWSVFKI